MYKEILDGLRSNFYERWHKNNPAAREGLEEFEKIRTLGTGSFGRVVSI